MVDFKPWEEGSCVPQSEEKESEALVVHGLSSENIGWHHQPWPVPGTRGVFRKFTERRSKVWSSSGTENMQAYAYPTAHYFIVSILTFKDFILLDLKIYFYCLFFVLVPL